jgi:ABC-2 type transport system permease protein
VEHLVALIMMFIIIYGNMVMHSVIEEKTSRIVEIIISSVNISINDGENYRDSSGRKLLQFFIWACLGFILLFSVSLFFWSWQDLFHVQDVLSAQPEMSSSATLSRNYGTCLLQVY